MLSHFVEQFPASLRIELDKLDLMAGNYFSELPQPRIDGETVVCRKLKRAFFRHCLAPFFFEKIKRAPADADALSLKAHKMPYDPVVKTGFMFLISHQEKLIKVLRSEKEGGL